MGAVQVRIGRRAALKLALGTVGALLAGCGGNSGAKSASAATRTFPSGAAATPTAATTTVAEPTTSSPVAAAVSRALASFVVGTWNIAAAESDQGDFSTPNITGIMTVTPGRWSYTAKTNSESPVTGTAPRGTWTVSGGTVTGTLQDPDNLLAIDGENISDFTLGGMPNIVPTGTISGTYQTSLDQAAQPPRTQTLQISIDTDRIVLLYQTDERMQWQTVATRTA